ncbi:MAG: tRNA (adenosine(37)-N6)-threonylcarbamoyltransferase complex dimerization subunit type 1 TsaB [Clostridia bacterium]|nr:tRNA (adenosine(37)-N6)-threonylcarbamoyltransferase complex dimerization subunit type 1 TsaB [Clostridia bacterium]
MKILAVDTTATSASVAVCEGNTVLATYTQKNGLTHSETLLPMIEAVLKNLKLTPDDIDMFAVSEGPGSFTGVRIGVAALKGLAFGKNKICVGTSTLDALARNAQGLPGRFLAVPVMDARRSQLYNAVFEYSGGVLTRLCEDRLISAAELEKELAGSEIPVYFFGDGYAIASKLNIPAKATTPQILILQNGASVAASALAKYESSEAKEGFTDLALSPKYLRASQAEREEERKRKEKSL